MNPGEQEDKVEVVVTWELECSIPLQSGTAEFGSWRRK